MPAKRRSIIGARAAAAAADAAADAAAADAAAATDRLEAASVAYRLEDLDARIAANTAATVTVAAKLEV